MTQLELRTHAKRMEFAINFEDGEILIRPIGDPKNGDRTYYTNDRDDALATMRNWDLHNVIPQ